MSTAVRGSAKKKCKRMEKIIRCSDCGFKSKRAFNVIRHYGRIHEPAKRELRCCGKKFLTKGQFYQHCVNVHPESRRSSIISLTKYKITTTEARKGETARRRSLRNVTRQKNEEIKRELDFDEDTPLIYYVKNPNFIKKEEKEEQDIKLEENCEKLDVDNCIEIFFKGDATSPLNAKIQKEFLRYINFDHFKII